MRIERLITCLCTALLAGGAAVYGAVLILMLSDGSIAEFSKVATGRSYTWAESPTEVVIHAILHCALLAFLVTLAVWTWRTLPAAMARARPAFRAMTGFHRSVLFCFALAFIATLAVGSFGLPADEMRRPTLALIAVLWSAPVVMLSLEALRLGRIRSSNNRVVRRSDDPAGFRRQWLRVTAQLAAVPALAALVCWMKW